MAYDYMPFRYKSSEIRLLTLFPSANSTAVVRCELKVVSLTHNPFYLALSYCWADPPDPKIIKLHNHDTEVTGNLYAALVSLRHERDATTWWIDALCINQNDIEERSLQVQRMTSIYSRAHFVVAWIGAETPSQASLHQYLNSTENLLHCEPSPGISHFRDLLSRKYWRRMWIVQEISVAADVWVVCGSSWIRWDKICEIFDRFEDLEREKPYKGITMADDFRLSVYHRRRRPMVSREPGVSNTTDVVAAPTWTGGDLAESYHGLQTFREFRSLASKRVPIGFVPALCRTSAFLATDPRDKFYAILGFTYDGGSFIFNPDYQINFENLQVQMARNFLQVTKNIEIVITRGHRPFSNESVPSWTPDWLNLGLEANYVFSTNSDQKFRAAGDSAFKPSRQQQDPRCIQVEGLIFELLDGLSTVYGELSPAHNEQTSLLQSTLNQHSVSYTKSKWLRSFFNSKQNTVRRNIILDLYYCLEGGLDLIPSSEGGRKRITSAFITSGPMWLYYGVDTTSEIDWWYKRFVARIQSKRRFDSPELSMWLKDNRDLLIRGQTIQSLCKADGDGRLLGTIWYNSALAPLLYILIILSIGGFISQAMVPTAGNARFWVIGGSGIVTLLGPLMIIVSLRIRWSEIKAAHIVQHGLLEKMDKYMKQRRLRLATTGGGPGDATGWGGLPALVPGSARRGDCIAILKGCSIPVLLREHGDGYQVIGSVFLEKAMDGELMKWPHTSWKVCKLY